jgi:hypothetical protein
MTHATFGPQFRYAVTGTAACSSSVVFLLVYDINPLHPRLNIATTRGQLFLTEHRTSPYLKVQTETNRRKHDVGPYLVLAKLLHHVPATPSTKFESSLDGRDDIPKLKLSIDIFGVDTDFRLSWPGSTRRRADLVPIWLSRD